MKFNFQFLEQKYGFFHCSKCNIRWESAYVWCISGSNKVYFKQLCRRCQVCFNPYRVESIQCQACGQTRCSCEKKQRHIDMKRPHRQDLCGRCRGRGCPATPPTASNTSSEPLLCLSLVLGAFAWPLHSGSPPPPLPNHVFYNLSMIC
ncbi:hypothetical protein AAFF_G00128080 [Aldrovandia affinis]|uniref:3CxxC-type domain-containing protein n=1 Tax=Aldrovandia affinis TaxID=143900 RepID=A0AAD7T134_9TELE|nr:hypothetical protein AAFF_G00128080 [Aldrovandia affinis]